MKNKIIWVFLTWSLVFSYPVNATIKIGTLFFNPPFVLSLNEGFDIDFSRLICKSLQQECVLIPMDFDAFFPALDSGKIDIAIGGISIPTNAQSKYIYSLPYMLCKRQFMILKDSAINSIEDLDGTTVGSIKGDEKESLSYNYLSIAYPGKFQVKLYDDIEDLVTALSSKEISAAFMHRSSVNYWIENGGDQFKSLGKVFTLGDGIGIMALPKNQLLIQQINGVLQTLEKDNGYLTLYSTYFPNE